MNFREWQTRNRLSDSDIFSLKHLEWLKLKPELVQCACGCGQLRPRFDKGGIERRFIQGHHSRGRKVSAETINKRQETRSRNKDLMIERVSEVDKKIDELIQVGFVIV